MRNERRNSILIMMTCYYPDLVGASDWLKIFVSTNQRHYPDLVSEDLKIASPLSDSLNGSI